MNKKGLSTMQSYIGRSARMSQAVIHKDTVYLSGQVGAPGESVENQTKAILAKIDGLLNEAETDKSHLLSATIWLADIKDFDEMNKVWDEWISECPAPARATGESKLASPDYKVEIIVIAAKS